MTAQAEVLNGGGAAPKPKPKQNGADKFFESAVGGMGLTGVSSWLAGTAALHGYHVSLPFVPTWLLLLAGTVVLSHGAGIVSAMWHYEKGKTAAQIAAQIRAGELTVEALAPGVLGALKDRP